MITINSVCECILGQSWREKTRMTPNFGMTDYLTHIMPRYQKSRYILGWEDKYFLNVCTKLSRLTFAISSRILRFRTVIRLLESKFCPGMSISSAYLSSSSSSLLWSFSWIRGKKTQIVRKAKEHLVVFLSFPFNHTLTYLFSLKLLLLLITLVIIILLLYSPSEIEV